MLIISRDIGIANIGCEDELLLCPLSCGSPRGLVKMMNTLRLSTTAVLMTKFRGFGATAQLLQDIKQ